MEQRHLLEMNGSYTLPGQVKLVRRKSYSTMLLYKNNSIHENQQADDATQHESLLGRAQEGKQGKYHN